MFNRYVSGDGVTDSAATEFSWGGLVTTIRVWVRQNFLRTLVMAVIGFLVGWVINTYIIAVRYEGNNAVSGVGTTGGFFSMLRNGGMYWGILSTIVFSLFAYGRQAGWRRLGQEIVSIPRVLRDTFVTGGTTAWAVLLWGGAISLAAAVLIGPAVAGILSVGLLLAAPSPISAIFGKVISRLLMGLIRLFAPAKQTDIPHLGGTVAGVAGTAAGMLLAWQVVSTPTKVVLAVAAAVFAFLLVTRTVTPPAAAGMLLVLVVVMVFRDLFDATAVLADDGGWQECGVDCSIIDWAQSPGATDVIIDASRGGVASGAGAALGTGLGSAVAGGAAPPGPGADTPIGPGPETTGPSGPEDGGRPDGSDQEEFPPPPDSGLFPPDGGEPEYPSGDEFPPPPDPGLFPPEGGEPELSTEGDFPPPPGEELGPDGTRVTTSTDPDGTQVVSEERPDGSSTSTYTDPTTGRVTTVETRPDGSSVETTVWPVGSTSTITADADGTVGSTGADADDEFPPPGEDLGPDGTQAATSTDSDGNQVVSEERPDGSSVSTYTDPTTGEVTTVETRPDGSSVETTVWPDGSTSTTTVDPDGTFITTDVDADGNETVSDGKPPRYRDKPIDTATTVTPGLEDDRIVDPDRVAVGPDGRPLNDPATGRPLDVDTEGNVKYGDGWMSPEEAASRIAIDEGWNGARTSGQALVDEFKDVREQLANETDPARRAELDQRLNELTNKINESYSGKNILKGEGRTAVGADYDARLSETYTRVDQDFIDRLNEMGFQRGGRPWTIDDITEFRNAASKGTVGMDRDIGLDEGKLRDLMNRLNELPPNTPEALRVTEQLAAEINRTKITVDYDKYTNHLEGEIARANAELERLSGDLANAAPGSAEAQRIQTELDRLGNRPADLQTELTRVQAEGGGRGVVEISPSKWNDTAASTYGRTFSDITGGDAQGAYQAVTQRHHQEAYGDKGVLSGEAERFDSGSAEQTASVSRVKAAENQHLADQGKITQGEAIQETARGYAKDIATKVNPHMSSNANVDPAKADMVRRIGEVLDKVGKGEIRPGQVDQALARAVPEVRDINLDKATRIVDSNFEGSLKSHAPRSRVGEVFGRVTDAATVDHYTRQHIAAGKDPAEAVALATAQTAAGNAVMASGIADPRTSMAGGALLPGGMNNMLPDQAVENWVGTTYDAGTAAVQSVSDSLESGQLDTRALDEFAEGVTQRQGADPFKGIGQTSQLLGEEWARTDGDSMIENVAQVFGNLGSDTGRIITTGAGSEVLNESMSNFQKEVAAGQHGVALQGLDDLANIASETVVDPVGTVGQFVDDVRNIVTHGVGDGYWEESWEHTKDVIEKTPLVGTVVDGYNQIATGLGDKGVVGFAEEMYEGGSALAGEAYEAAGNAVGGVYDYLKNMW